MKTPNYRDFCRDMMKLCEKHGVQIGAYDEGNVFLGPVKAKTMRDFPFCEMKFTPTEATLRGSWSGSAKPLEMTREKGEAVDGELLEVAKGFVENAPHLDWCQYLDGCYDESVRCTCGLLVFRQWFGC